MKSNVTSEIVPLSADQTWPLRYRVLWPEENPESIKLPEDPGGIHFGLQKNGQLISVISIFIREMKHISENLRRMSMNRIGAMVQNS